jgi:threonine synthase
MAKRKGELIDPHTAIGLAVVKKLRARGSLQGPVVALATAHPAKFPDAVQRATGARPLLPPGREDLFERRERLVEAQNDAAAIRAIMLAHARPRDKSLSRAIPPRAEKP